MSSKPSVAPFGPPRQAASRIRRRTRRRPRRGHGAAASTSADVLQYPRSGLTGGSGGAGAPPVRSAEKVVLTSGHDRL